MAKRWKKLFAEFAYNHQVNVFGDVSPKLFEIVNVRLAGKVKASWYAFLDGFGPEASLGSTEPAHAGVSA